MNKLIILYFCLFTNRIYKGENDEKSCCNLHRGMGTMKSTGTGDLPPLERSKGRFMAGLNSPKFQRKNDFFLFVGLDPVDRLCKSIQIGAGRVSQFFLGLV